MTDDDKPDEDESAEAKSFREQSEEGSVGIVREFIDFLKYNKKWWLLPIVLMLFIVGLIVVLGNTVVAPFIYTLF